MSELIDRTAAAVGCSHCRKLGASQACAICGRPVCAACTAPSTCPEPSAQELRLGWGKRLRAVDDQGRVGLVTSWSGRRRWLYDLDAQEVVRELPNARLADRLSAQAGLGPDGLFVELKEAALGEILRAVGGAMDPGGRRVVAGGRQAPAVHLLAGQVRRAKVTRIYLDQAWTVRHLELSEDGRFAAATAVDGLGDWRLALVDLERQRVVRRIECARAIQSVALSRAHDLLAIGQWQKVLLHRLSREEYLGAVHAGTSDVAWVGFGGGKLALITDAGELSVLLIDRLTAADHWPVVREASLAIDSSLALAEGDQPSRRRVRASLSDDGRLLAAREHTRELSVIDLTTGDRQPLSGHTDRINLVRFVQGGRRLISADLDNRVISWPRSLDDHRLAAKVVRRPAAR